SKAPPANDGTAAKKSAADTNGEDDTPSGDIKATLGAVVTEGAPVADEGKPLADNKPTITEHPDDPKTDESQHSGQAPTANESVGLMAAHAAPAAPSPDQISLKEPQDESSLAEGTASQLNAWASGPPKVATGKQTGPVKQPDTEQSAEPEQVSGETVGD